MDPGPGWAYEMARLGTKERTPRRLDWVSPAMSLPLQWEEVEGGFRFIYVYTYKYIHKYKGVRVQVTRSPAPQVSTALASPNNTLAEDKTGLEHEGLKHGSQIVCTWQIQRGALPRLCKRTHSSIAPRLVLLA